MAGYVETLKAAVALRKRDAGDVSGSLREHYSALS